MSQGITTKTKLAAIEARANGMGPGPEFLQTKQALQEDIPWLVTELRAALERAEKAEAVLTGYGVSGVGSRIEKLLSERDAALAKLKMFENRRKLAYSLRAESPQVAAFVEAIGAEMDKIGASPLRSDAPSQPMGLEIARDGQAAGDLDAVDHRSAKGFMPAVFENISPKTAPDNQMDYPPAAVHLDRSMVSVHGSDGCSSCDTGRITIYAASRQCLDCRTRRPTRSDGS